MNIVIVDDEKLIRQGLAFIISQISSKYKVIAQCKNGLEALQFCLKDTSNVQLVITDVRMHEMDGLELIAELKKQLPHIHTLVMSGYDEFDYVLRALRMGAQDYLLKPIDKIELMTLLERIHLHDSFDLSEASSLLENKKAYKDGGYVQTIVQDNLLNGLIQRDPGISKDARVHLEENYEINDQTHAYLLAGVIIDEMPYHPLQHADRVLFQYFIRKMAEEFLSAAYAEKTAVFQGHNGIVYICFFLKKGCSDEMDQVRVLESLLTAIKQHIVYPITIGISSIAAAMNEFGVLGEQLQTVIRARLILGSGIVLQAKAIQNLQQHFDLPKDFMKQMLIDIESKDKDAILTNVSTFLKQLRSMELQPQLAIDLIIRLFIRVSGQLQERGLELKQAGVGEWAQLNKELEQCPTWELVENYVAETFSKYIDLIQRHALEGKPAFILNAIEYIQIHYASDITLHEVADTVRLYPTYLSEQFKLHMNNNFIDYLTQIRINKAKELLRKSDKPAFLICEEVGYSTPAHFSKVFKKWEDCTPIEYRKRYQNHLIP